jgi:predicted MPP superfamily phosphohydrolase
VRTANAARPHLVLIAGDFVDREGVLGSEVEPEAVARALSGLRAPLGSFAVLGNHDRDFGWERVVRALTPAGIAVLRNRAARLEHEGHALWVAGAEDIASGLPDLEAALGEVPDDEPVLLLTHSPDLFPHVPARVALTVAGHTHGAQLAIPVLRGLVVPSRFGTRYARGHVVEGERHLYVHAGIGTSELPIRMGVPPRVAALTLLPARARGRRLPRGRGGY